MRQLLFGQRRSPCIRSMDALPVDWLRSAVSRHVLCYSSRLRPGIGVWPANPGVSLVPGMPQVLPVGARGERSDEAEP